MRDAFLALSDDLAPAGGRNGGYSLMAMAAVVITTVCLSLGGLFLGAHVALAAEPVTRHLSLPRPVVARVLEPAGVVLGWGCWLGAVLLSIWPPRDDWRGWATFALVLSPPGCVLRFYLALWLNGRLAAFSLGTFAANVGGTAVLGMAWDLAHAPVGGAIGCQVLQGRRRRLLRLPDDRVDVGGGAGRAAAAARVRLRRWRCSSPSWAGCGGRTASAPCDAAERVDGGVAAVGGRGQPLAVDGATANEGTSQAALCPLASTWNFLERLLAAGGHSDFRLASPDPVSRPRLLVFTLRHGHRRRPAHHAADVRGQKRRRRPLPLHSAHALPPVPRRRGGLARSVPEQPLTMASTATPSAASATGPPTSATAGTLEPTSAR